MEKIAGPQERNWSYDDPKAPKSPWGNVQTLYEHPSLRGVRWVSTPGHGGLGVADGVARKVLTPAAYRMGDREGGYVWYEEDVAATIPFFEHPEWYQLLFGKPLSDADIARNERSLRQYFPRYFKLREEGYILPPKLSVGDRLEVLDLIRLSRGAFRPGDTLTVTKLTSDYIYVTPDPAVPGIQAARLPASFYTGVSATTGEGDKVFLRKTASVQRVAARFFGLGD